jgi:hypothetical protein
LFSPAHNTQFAAGSVVTVTLLLADETLFEASFALTVNVYAVFGVSPLALKFVALGPVVDPARVVP